MKQFKFRLTPILRYRKYLEQMALMELAKAKRSLAQTKQRIKVLEQKQYDALVDLQHEESQGIDVIRHRLFLAYLRGLSDRIAIEKDRLIEVRAMVRETQKAFEAERIKRESLELLRQIKHEKYVKEIGLVEQKAADELMSLRWSPKRALLE